MRKSRVEVAEQNVRKANALIQKARFSLTTQQQKLILYLIAQIQPTDKEFSTYKLNIADFCRVCGISLDSGRDYEQIKEMIKKIADKSMWITLEDGTESLVRWIENPSIRKQSGIIQLRLNEDLKPYLLQLKKKYTEYQLIYTLSFNSKYSIRLYELACSIHYNKLEDYSIIYTLDEIRKLLDCESYTVWKDFRRDVLDKAIEEVNKYSDKTISYEIIKTGRPITHIELTVSTKTISDRVRIELEAKKNLGLIK